MKQMHHTTVQKRFKNNFTVLRSSLKIRKSSKQSLSGQSEAPKLFYNALQEQKTEIKKPNNLNIVNLGFWLGFLIACMCVQFSWKPMPWVITNVLQQAPALLLKQMSNKHKK